MSEHLYNCDQVADQLGVSTDWVRRKVQARTVPHVRLGRKVRFTDAQVAQLVEQYTQQAIPRGRRSKL